MRSEFEVESDRALVVAIGRLHPQKGFDILIEAAELLRSAGQKVAVRIVGEGPARAALQRQCTMTQADLRLVGHRADIADVVAAADVVVMPSRWEGWPMTAAEVLSAGRPLIATAVGGIPEMVADAAVLVPPDDARALATAIAEVVTHPDIGRRLCGAALERARSLPTDDAVAAQMLQTYRAARRGAP